MGHRIALLSARALLVVLAGSLSGCTNDLPGPSGPGSLTPFVSSITPATGTTAGGTGVTISGTGFKDGVVVSIGGAAPSLAFLEPGSTRIRALVPAHAAGPVDVVVTNPTNGLSGKLVGGYTYASPDSFDLNGIWAGSAAAGEADIPLQVTIQNNELVSFSCGASGTIAPATRPAVSNGEFVYTQADGVSISGRILSASQVTGAINLAPCVNTTWGADTRTVAGQRH